MNAARILMIDNYDSFTFNLVQYLGELGADVHVRRNDEVKVSTLRKGGWAGMVISPGPGTPKDAGVSVEAILALEGRIPILGVCLGHQCLAVAHGGRVRRGARILHGKTSPIHHRQGGLLAGLENPFEATRYHSLEVAREDLPQDLVVEAWTAEEEIMAMRHDETETWGVQFHPESILTEGGMKMMENFLDLCRRSKRTAKR